MHDVFGVTPAFTTTSGKLKNVPDDHGGIEPAPFVMLAQYSVCGVRSVRVCDVSELSLVPSLST